MGPEFQSEIRDSQVNQLLERVQGKNYRQYISSVTLLNVRGFREQKVDFDFPVTALIGPNGGGKTTVLGAAACAYADVKPRRFFAKSGKFDDSMQDWKIQYELVDRDVKPRDPVQRTATFRSFRWYRDALSREVSIFGISRTVPANERTEMKKCASNRFSVAPDRIETIGTAVATAVGQILGKDISQYSRVKVDKKGRVSLLTGQTANGVGYSEFHFGAGESSIIRMIIEIESLPDNSLVLIEEIENGLHPVATIRMVEYLIDLAERKRVQAVFTTHSNDALKPLPSKAIWACLSDKTVQGKLDIDSLRAIKGEVNSQLIVFTEDPFAKAWVDHIIRAHRGVDPHLVEVHALAGDGTAVETNRYHNQDPSSRTPSICIIDGDSQQVEDTRDGIFRLPGAVPETAVFDSVRENLNDQGGQLAVALHKPFEQHEQVAKVVEEVRLTNRDPHLLFSQVGKRLGFIPATTVRDAFLFVWCEINPESVDALMQPVLRMLDERDDASVGNARAELGSPLG